MFIAFTQFSHRQRPFTSLTLLLALCTVLGCGGSYLPGVCETLPQNPILRKAALNLQAGEGERALAIYEAYLKAYPKSYEADLGIARIAERENNFPEAREHLEAALAKHPEQVEITAELARLFHRWSTQAFAPRQDYKARAQEFFQQAIGLAPSNPRVLTYFGEWSLDNGDTVAAERSFQKALQQDPAFIPAYQGLGRYYLTLQELRRAKEVLLHAVELDPQNSFSYYLLSDLLAKTDHPEESAKFALKSQQQDFGTLPERDLLLAQQFEKLGDTVQALQYYEKLLSYDPRHAPTLLKVAEGYEVLNQPTQSLTYYRKAVEADPSLLTQLITKAQETLRTEKVPEAIRQWRRILAIQPGQEDALHGLASAHFLNHFYQRVSPETAQADLQTFEENVSDYTPLLGMDRIKLLIAVNGTQTPLIRERLTALSNSEDDLAAGEALFLLERYPEALERLDAVDGQTAQGYLVIADRLLLDQELVTSRALYQRGYQMETLPALKQGMDRNEAKRNLASKKVKEGNERFDMKNYEGALEKYRQASQIYRQWDTPFLRLGDTYEHLKQKVQAFQAYRKAVTLNPNLLSSKGFGKKYRKLEKNALKR